jgi:trehalose 6-phosphate phosphatase
MRPLPSEEPSPLPAGLPTWLAAKHNIFLFLDYDGTLSEITPEIAQAKPVAGARDLIEQMAALPGRFRVALISGRRIHTLTELFGAPRGVTLVGNHGLEIMDPGGRKRMAVDPALFMPALDAARDWLRRNVPYEAGFVVEDKRFSVALHYRLADPDAALKLRLRMREFVRTETPELVIGEGKMVIEAMPHHANKGEAVRTLMREDGEDRLAVYFGDDVTDEDAFFVLRGSGVTIKVGKEPGPSWAQYCVDAPAQVVAALRQMVWPPDL